MKRQIIKIDEKKCNGCGICIPGCPEGALQIIDGKARLVSDLFCDGLGACIGECPEGAISVEEREAEPYDEISVMENIVKQGDNTIKAHLKHLKDHNEIDLLEQAIGYLEKNNFDVSNFMVKDEDISETLPCGCPSSMTVDLKKERIENCDTETIKISSELQNWPVQLQLINPGAGYFKEADLIVVADCVPFAYADFHREFVKDRILINFCPKLDVTIDEYIMKLTEIFKNHDIRSVTIAKMEVPCCSGVERIISTALKNAGRDVNINTYTISIKGDILNELSVVS